MNADFGSIEKPQAGVDAVVLESHANALESSELLAETSPSTVVVRQAVIRLASDALGKRTTSEIDSTSSLIELGIDSLGGMRLIGSIERNLGIELPDEMFLGQVTIDDIVNHIVRQT
ncbi:acyl carrier protein [Streptomyces sp. NPDC087908]|uniref:acyl carrier protein n=1 Tax=Streptomyces sp. NPDC087908 TaxID=3365820 RepID=UPI0037F3F305